MAEPEKPKSLTPPPIRAVRWRTDGSAKFSRSKTLPENDPFSETLLTSQAPSQFGWFNQHQTLDEYKKVLLRLAEDKQLEVNQQQDDYLNQFEVKTATPTKTEDEKHVAPQKGVPEPVPENLHFRTAAQKLINVNAFISQIQQGIHSRMPAPNYPRRSAFKGVSRYRKYPQVVKMTEVLESTKQESIPHLVWNKIKKWRRIISSPFLWIESVIESRFGTSAVSYFVLLKRLIIVNLFVAFLSAFIWLPAVLPCSSVTTNSTCLLPVYNRPTDNSFQVDSLLTGRGLDNTSLFLGYYRYNPKWDYKSAYFYTFFVSTFCILVYISYMLGQAYINTFSILQSTRHISSYMANLVFGGWTYNLTNPFSVKSEHKRLTIVLRESVWECSPRHSSQRLFLYSVVESLIPTCSSNMKHLVYICCLWMWRAVVWIIALTLLLMGASLIVITALQRVCADKLFIYGFIPSLWHTFLELVFTWLTALEFYDTQRKAMLSLLIKHLLMRFISLSSIYTVVIFIYFLSRCEGTSSIKFPLCFSGQDSTSRLEPVKCLASGCWETEVAKLFHEYLVAQFISSVVIRSAMITLQNLIRIGVFWFIKHCSLCYSMPAVLVGGIKNFFNTHFHLPKHVIKLIYIQSLVWSGMVFCPYQHIIGFIGFILLYFSMFLFTMWNCRISPKQPRTARSNLIYYIIIFCTFFFIMMALSFPLFEFVPSDNCGPFSGTSYYYEFYREIHLRWVSEKLSLGIPRGDSSQIMDKVSLININFWDSPATGPLTVLTVGILLLYFATLKKKNDEILQLRKQVLLLAVDRSFYIQGNTHFLSALSQKYIKQRKGRLSIPSIEEKTKLTNY